jgi:hypothetical protein
LRLRGGHCRNFRCRFLNRGWFFRRRRCHRRRFLDDDFRRSGDGLNGLWFGRRRLLHDDRSRRFDDRLWRGRRWRWWRRRWRYRLRRRRRGCGGSRLDGLDEARRPQYWRGRLRRLGLLRRRRFLRAALGWNRVLSEHIAARQRDVALTGDTLDERARDDFFDRARRAFQLDAVVALQQREYFLARRVEQFRDFVNPNR